MKLVREKTALRIDKENPSSISDVYNQDEYDMFLKLKLSEELSELKDSKYCDVSEYADVFEVLHTLANVMGISWDEIMKEKERKLQAEGSFGTGYIWKNNQK